jgi:ATP-dependent Clp protease ATP-binding subunit ClpC
MEEGELRDSLGHTVNFRNTIIIMTSNAGGREITKDTRLGFSAASGIMSAGEIETQAMQELRRIFSPEFINRVDDIVVFNPLSRKQIDAIFDIEFEELKNRLMQREYSLKITKNARNTLAEKGWDPKYGGRLLRRTIQKEIECPLSQLLLESAWESGTIFTVDAKDGHIRLRGKRPAPVEQDLVFS